MSVSAPRTAARSGDAARTTGPEVGGAVTYIRGAGGAPVDGRRCLSVIVVATSALVLLVVGLLTLSAWQQDLRAARLRAHGVAVTVVITDCVGLASGTGITTVGYTCRGTFAVGGHRHSELLRGSASRHAAGDRVAAVVVPDDPASVTSRVAASAGPSPVRPFAGPGVVAGLWLAAVAAWRVRATRRRGGSRAATVTGGHNQPGRRAVIACRTVGTQSR